MRWFIADMTKLNIRMIIEIIFKKYLHTFTTFNIEKYEFGKT